MLKNSTNYSTNFIFWVERSGGPISLGHLFYSLEFGPNKEVNWIFLSFTTQICVSATHILDSHYALLLSYGTCVFNCDVLKWVLLVRVYIILYSLKNMCAYCIGIYSKGSGPRGHPFNIFRSEGCAYLKLSTMCNHSLRSSRKG